jgi:hypothetical protein
VQLRQRSRKPAGRYRVATVDLDIKNFISVHLTSSTPHIIHLSMAELSSGVPVSQGESAGESSSTFEKIQELLKSKDDTSRFVGLALLKSILDNGQLVQNPEGLRKLWESISPKFIDRLLRARPSDKVKSPEAQNMVDLAVSVLHTFTNLLPKECQKDARVVERTSHLVKALVERLVLNIISRL